MMIARWADRDGRTAVASFGMWVAATDRGRGVGRALVDECLRWSAAVGAHKVTLEAWPHNGAAIALYRSAGFEVEGRRRRHYRRRNGELWDAVIMAKVLDLDSPGSALPDALT
jgi:ribosomal protein S18 acetylase RimI-like enzyme